MSTFEYGHFRSAAELRAGVLIWQIISPLLIIFGTFGNALSIFILSKRKFNRWASTVYLLGLAVADLCVLYVGLMRQWIKYLFDTDIRSVHPVLCKVHWWLMYSCADIPVWILTCITVERLFSAICPYKSKNVCTRNRAHVILVFIVISALSINSHLLYGFGKLEISSDNMTVVLPCVPITAEYEYFFEKIWTWVDLCKFSLVPFVVLSVGNFCIIYKLMSSGRKLKSQVRQPSSQQQTSPRAARTSNMTKILLSLNFVFITCTLPVCIYLIGESYWVPEDVPRSVQLKDPWWAAVNMLMYTNNTINFILYCLTGSRFRESVRKMFRCRDKISRDLSRMTNNSVHSRSVAI